MPLYKVEHVPAPQTDPPTPQSVDWVIAPHMRRGIRDVEDSYLPAEVTTVLAQEVSATVILTP